MNDFDICRATEYDIDEVHGLIDDNLRVILEPIHGEDAMKMAYNECSKAALLQQLSWKEIYVAKFNNVIIGTASLANFGMNGMDRWCVSNVFVSLKFHRNGIGRSLVEWIIAKAKDRSAIQIEVPSSRYAVAFYENCGFAISGIPDEGELTWMKMQLHLHPQRGRCVRFDDHQLGDQDGGRVHQEG